MNIWELTKRRGTNAKELLRIALALGIPVQDEWTPLSGDDVQRIDEELQRLAEK